MRFTRVRDSAHSLDTAQLHAASQACLLPTAATSQRAQANATTNRKIISSRVISRFIQRSPRVVTNTRSHIVTENIRPTDVGRNTRSTRRYLPSFDAAVRVAFPLYTSWCTCLHDLVSITVIFLTSTHAKTPHPEPGTLTASAAWQRGGRVRRCRCANK